MDSLSFLPVPDRAQMELNRDQPDRGMSESPPLMTPVSSIPPDQSATNEVQDMEMEMRKVLQDWCVSNQVRFLGSAVRDEKSRDGQAPR